MKRLSVPLREANPDVPWSQIAGMRDVLIHAYHRVDLDAVWNVVEMHLPALKKRVVDLSRTRVPDGARRNPRRQSCRVLELAIH